ncbi:MULTISPECIES: CBO0543 family protein [unclassified Paenibacillus]|uniref:CBO0543 family protein n=1 Tax=unclassified Paenibacillus TaxID=185978 RepID=UPI0007099FF0|nr:MULTISPECIES: CBO0543 family protein [unclassified Paenibacillus]KQX48300.1 hypothetical protein ASD40_08800 [Paenibacillus sp. Root444D2]KRE52266.1 hypothetical protein ASG85_03840 [Paenibacillus sp. Soil724D2]
MSKDRWVLTAVWVLSFGLIFTIPRRKIRLAVMSFLFKLMLTCPIGLIVVEYNLVAYPVVELPDVSRTSMTYEYFAYPIICMVFNCYYPSGRSRCVQFSYYIIFCMPLTITEVILEHYTNLVRYVHWSWFCTMLSLMITFLLSRMFCVWFFNRKRAPASNM